MTYIDIAFGFLAGVVSCLTPQALLLLPLAFVAAGAVSRTNVIAPAFGLGFALARILLMRRRSSACGRNAQR